jgi:hypothetical protein
MSVGITSGYNVWIHETRRAKSSELNFGAWWEMEGTQWRVSWIEDTGELYAAELASDRYLVLGHFATKRDISRMMHNWFDGDNLAALVRRLKH